MRIGLLPLARATFDVAFAQEMHDAMRAALKGLGHDLVGSKELLFEPGPSEKALEKLTREDPDRVLILQVTFTDAAFAAKVAATFPDRISLWAIPEPRLGGRLRLNSFCGLNLFSHMMSRAGHEFAWAYGAPDAVSPEALEALVQGASSSPRPTFAESPDPSEDDRARAERIRGKRIARIGEHPAGFDTCRYDSDALSKLAGVTVDAMPLETLFGTANVVDPGAVADTRAAVAAEVTGLDAVDQAELDRSLRLKSALDVLRDGGGYDAFALRCWPETFTEYGGAVCGPAAMMGEGGVPCACEADVYGALTQLILRDVAEAPVFLTDLVDLDTSDGTGVVWHCGQAPLSMRAEGVEATATIHSNRRMPLLFEFPLKPGRVTFVRLSQAFNEPTLILGGGEMLERPMAFTGTSGTVRFDGDAGEVLDRVIGSGLEHHMALAYGEHRPALRGLAAALGLPILEL